jgi:hypothetical protein
VSVLLFHIDAFSAVLGFSQFLFLGAFTVLGLECRTKVWGMNENINFCLRNRWDSTALI